MSEQGAESREGVASGGGGWSRGRSLVVIGLLVFVAILGFGAGRWSQAAGANGGETGTASGTSTGGTPEGTQQYTCPMHPDVRSDDPDDTCPICGMDLVPVKEGSKGSEKSGVPALELSDRAIEVARVRTAIAERRKVSREIEVYGRVEAAEEAETDLTSWVRGRIEHLDITATGQNVRRGERIARLYSPKLESVQKELLQALKTARQAKAQKGGASSARVRSARSAAEAARSRLRVLGMNDAQIEAIVESGESREVVNVHAETGGTVRKRHAFEGEWVDVGDPIASLQGLDTVWVQLEIYQRDLPLLEKGMPVQLTLPSRPAFERRGRIEFIDPVVDPSDGTTRARVVVSNANGELPPGTDVRASIEVPLEEEPPPLSVPESAVLWTGPRSVVYEYDRSMEPPKFVPHEVELGPRVGPRRVIRKGIEEGDEIAVHGAFQLDAELQIRGEPSMMTGLPPSQRVLESVEVPEEGKKYEPAIQPERLPEGVWYCPMQKTHWAQPKEGEGQCPVCGMHLKKSGGQKPGSHDHGSMDEGSREQESHSGEGSQ